MGGLMKVGVIGGSGFIGSHLVDKLIENGHDVTVFDIMRPHRDDVRHIFLDLFDFHKVVVALAGNYDAIYLLAAMANINDIHKNPLETALVNFQGVVNVLEAMRRYGGRLIFASTVWVYILAEGKTLDENSPLLVQNVNHTYTASKVAAELYIQSYHKLYGLDFTILRYGIPYGPRGRVGTVVTNFIVNALKGEPIVIFGDGKHSRYFIYVEDLAEGNAAALKEVARNQIYNLQGLRKVSIKEIADIVKRLVGSVKIEYAETRPGDYDGRIISSEKARKDLEWEPKVDIEEGIRRYIKWYKKQEKIAETGLMKRRMQLSVVTR
jgi:UDP-glucose 4-epimerase